MDEKLFPSVIGNERIRTLLGSDIRKNRLGHAYILEGPPGSGRHFFALQIAAAVSCEKRHDPSAPLPCGTCASCRKLLAQEIPHESESLPSFRFHATDLLVVRKDPERKTRNIPVAVIRDKMIPNTWIAPEENTKKVYVVEDLDYSERSAQNSMLIPMENPPDYVLYLLIAEDASGLLETVRSRAPMLRMETFGAARIREVIRCSSDRTITGFIESHPDEFAEAVQLSGGTIGATLAELRKRAKNTEGDESPYHMKRAYAVAITKQLFAPDIMEAIPLLQDLSGKKKNLQREDIKEILEMVITALRDLIVLKRNVNADTQFLLPSDTTAFSTNISLAKILAAQDEVISAFNDVSSNVNINTVLESLIVK